jgi:glycosyltransferase involved in cell wall biosynthesis
MLSILIPNYNYNALPLVSQLANQSLVLGILFEILVLDDASTDQQFLSENLKINAIPNCNFITNETNLGRAKNRNKLADLAQYDCFLYLDSDTLPTTDDFVEKYILSLKTSKICFGGLAYANQKPNKENLLRWKFGRKREAISLHKRLKNPYQSAFTSNLLIQKSVFNQIKFDQRIVNYGYEDFVFFQKIKASGIQIVHILNPVYHINYETSIVFLNKTQQALHTLKSLTDNPDFDVAEVSVLKLFQLLKQLGLNDIIASVFTTFESHIIQHLSSKRPWLFVFDLYKLGYFCKINQS